jgi:hypothetical protein
MGLCYLNAEFAIEFARGIIVAVHTRWLGQFDDESVL